MSTSKFDGVKKIIESDFLMNNTNCFDESEIGGDRIHPFH
jgi:hypothetical protein